MLPRSLALLHGVTFGYSPGNWLTDPQELRSTNGILDVTLSLNQYLLTGPGFEVFTRAYNNSVPAPTLRVKSGDVLRVTLQNRLGPNAEGDYVPDTIGRLNTTNLHFHGFHGSARCGDDQTRPDVCSDNVFIAVEPGASQVYEYHVAQAPGTFWYHPHAEGSTAVQVGAGAAGAIVIEDDDSIPAWLSQIEERVLVLQEIFMRDCNIRGIRFKGCPGTPGLEAQGHGDLSQPKMTADDPVLWYFAINGGYQPMINVTAGTWQRWRFIMAGANTNLRLQVDGCELQLLAKDGIYLSPAPRVLTGSGHDDDPGAGKPSIFLSPANRADVLIRCPAAGNYAIRSVSPPGLPGQPTFPGVEGTNATIATVVAMPQVRPQHIDVVPFTPKRPHYLQDLTVIPDTDIAQKLTLELMFNGPQDLTLNGRKFSGEVDPNNASTYLNKMGIGTIQEWNYAPSGTHPFHMHVNPMQIVHMPPSSDYGNWWLVGDFHDVMRAPYGGGATRFRFYIDNFPGNIVLHCHILRHEDLGLLAASIAE